MSRLSSKQSAAPRLRLTMQQGIECHANRRWQIGPLATEDGVLNALHVLARKWNLPRHNLPNHDTK